MGLVLLSLVVFSKGCNSGPERPPAVAGSFYPSEPGRLRETVKGYIEGAEINQPEGRLYGLLCPHAGYQYSGAVAGYCYRSLKGRSISTVILIGPSHYEAFRGVAVYPSGAWLSPLGKVKIDSRLAKQILNPEADVRAAPEVFKKEHSLEVQVPFLQILIPEVRIVPLLVGHPTKASFEYLKDKLARILAKRQDVVLVLSSDLSHYHPYDRARKMDMKVLDALQRLSVEDLQRLLSGAEAEMCGAYPAIYALSALRQAGATNGVLFKYMNSGDVVPAMKSRVVGYGAMGFYKTALTRTQKITLLRLARQAIQTYVLQHRLINPEVKDPRLRASGASFVTIKVAGHRLRGCIGNLLPYLPLYESVIRNAVAASSRDPRFPPMAPDELKDMEVEVTVLSPMEPVEDIDEIQVGKHGLYLLKGNHSGVLLPQVPVEFGWDRDTFLKQLALKAGLSPDDWQGANLYKFTAEVFSERDMGIEAKAGL